MSLEVTYFGALIAGLISFLSPCVLPLVPPYLCYLGGTTFDELAAGDDTPREVYRDVVAAAVMFVLGFTTVFVSLGATATAIGQVLASNLDLLAKIAGGVIILLGLHFIGLVRIPFLNREARYHGDARPAGLIGAYVIGLAFAFGWTPCIGPVLAVILFMAAGEETVLKGVSLLFIYSLGLGVPFVVAAVAVRPFLNFLQRFKRYLPRVEQAMGAFLVLTGIFFITGWMTIVSTWMLEAFPALATLG